MLLCIVLFPNTEGASVPAQRRSQSPTNQHYMRGVSQSTRHFCPLLLCATHHCFIRDFWRTAVCLLSAPLSVVGLVTPLHVYLRRSGWGERVASVRSRWPGPPGHFSCCFTSDKFPVTFGFPNQVTWINGRVLSSI